MKTEHRVTMAKSVAEKWVLATARAEYRVSAFPGPHGEIRHLASLLRSWRDGHARIASLKAVADLGIREGSENGFLEYWSSDRDGIRALTAWLESKGYETSGVW